MKHQLITLSLLSVAAFATTVLRADFAAPSAGQLTDYRNWFDNTQFSFDVISDNTYYNSPSPLNGTPPAGTYNDGIRNVAQWSGWASGSSGPNTHLFSRLPSPLSAGIFNISKKSLFVETLFLGETAGWYNDFGYRITKFGGAFTDYSLAKDIQSVGGGSAIKFGDFQTIEVKAGERLDFFFTGTGVKSGDGTAFTAPGAEQGGKYWLFGSYANSPAPATLNLGFGILDPLYSVRSPAFTAQSRGSFTVVGLEDKRDEGTISNDRDANDFLFAFRTSFDDGQTEIPEPSTYGLIGAAVLGGLIGYRRLKANRKA